jgi:hypothetical protein
VLIHSGAVRSRDKNAHRSENPDAEEKGDIHKAIREGGRSQRTRSNVSHHERINQAHQHLADLPGHNRASEGQRSGKLCPKASGVRHRPFTKPGFHPLASLRNIALSLASSPQ